MVERRFRNPSAVGLRILCVFREVGGDVGDDAGPEFVYDRGEGYRSVVVEDGGVCLLVDKEGLAVHPGFGGVSLPSHALEEEGEGRVEDGGHGFE